MDGELVFIAIVMAGAFMFMLPLLLIYLLVIWLTDREVKKKLNK